MRTITATVCHRTPSSTTVATAVMETTKNNNVQLLAAMVNTNGQEDGDFRFLVDGTHVKYVTVAPAILPKDHCTFGPTILAGLPPFPEGDWNTGHVDFDIASGEPAFVRTEKATLQGVQTLWHPTRIDHLELRKLDCPRQNILIASHPRFDRPVLAKFTEFPELTPYLEAETAAYQWVEGTDIAPRFLGHLTEEGRVIGFVLEYIENARAAGPGDLAACQSVLKKLHALGIKHGNINNRNFLVRDHDGTVILLDFEMAKKDASVDELEAEYQRLAESLQDPSL
ncbi:hypothetical protein B0T19DRAFT_413497 [Cercophora scortea]|uniref:Alpha-galactosidase A n=1 Tax=Cercophora scortea TaxID=314031 RepID=A0AAE0J6C6_9PEZI|nr:hypothetical protein B0T19DRAFT_413497 [Cercophora scortea]